MGVNPMNSQVQKINSNKEINLNKKQKYILHILKILSSKHARLLWVSLLVLLALIIFILFVRPNYLIFGLFFGLCIIGAIDAKRHNTRKEIILAGLGYSILWVVILGPCFMLCIISIAGIKINFQIILYGVIAGLIFLWIPLITRMVKLKDVRSNKQPE
jgi:hypothetical protein